MAQSDVLLMRTHSEPSYSVARGKKPHIVQAAPSRASLADRLVRIDRDSPRGLINNRAHVTREDLPTVASDSPTLAGRDPTTATTTAVATDSLRRITRDALKLFGADFCEAVRRATMIDPSVSSKPVEVVLASPVTCPAEAAAPCESRTKELRVFKAEIKRLAAVEHPNLLKWIGVLEWSHNESFVPTSPSSEQDEAVERAERGLGRACHFSARDAYQLVAIVWEGGFRDNLAQFARSATPEQVFAVLRDVAWGLVELHSKGRAHGNVCCENIVITANDRGKLGDFQLASCLKPVCNPKVDRVAAPELILERWESGESTRRSFAGDVFSLAMAAIVALTRELPFGLMTEEGIIEKLQISKVYCRPDGIDDEVWARLSPMLSANPYERPSMGQVYAAFYALSGEAP